MVFQIAGRFADNEDLCYTVQEKNGPKWTDFSDKIPYYSKKVGEFQFTKPVIVLTDNNTISAAEVLLLYLKSYKLVTQIGDKTAGDFSDTSMRRFLPNGWQYQYSIFMYLLPNGESLDGIGHIPDVFVRNSESDIDEQNDLVIERAFRYLLEEYGIN